MQELWQAYDDSAQPIAGKGITKDEAYSGILHAASHVWIWRRQNGKIEVLLQRRAADKRTWPNLLDISAAGHIDLGESPIQAAIREAQEEIGYTPAEQDLKFIHIHKAYLTTEGGIENEFQWVYALELSDQAEFSLADGEVESLEWKDLATFKAEVFDPQLSQSYVPHGKTYFKAVTEFIKQQV